MKRFIPFYLVIALLLALMCAKHATAQTMDPHPDEPYAQEIAESRAAGALMGLMPPPVGWVCILTTTIVTPQFLGVEIYFVEFLCEPDVLAVEAQETERLRWIQSFVERSERLGRRR